MSANVRAEAVERAPIGTAIFSDAFENVRRSIERGPIYPTVTATEIQECLANRYDFCDGMDLDEVVADVQQMLDKWQVQVTHPRYFGLFNPSVGLASVIADTITAMYNPQLANWRTSPGANGIERHTLLWMAGKFGLPPESGASFTSGGTEANLSAIIVALTKMVPGYGEGGVRALNASPAIYLTQEAHSGYNKLAHITGLGRRALRIVKTDGRLKMEIDDLRRRVAEDREAGLAPCMVIGTAGTTATGVIDPLQEISDFCREAGLWFHADAAWGGAAILSPALKHHLDGIALADSITCDAHKWLSVPMGCGMFFCRHADAMQEAFRAQTTYMPGAQTGGVADPLSTSVQWSRRFIGLKLFMSLAERGESGYAELIDHQADLGNLLRTSLMESGWRILNDTPLPVVCFARDGVDVSELLGRIRERQIAWMSSAEVSGVPAIRACITSYRTTADDIRWVVGELKELIGQESAHSA